MKSKLFRPILITFLVITAAFISRHPWIKSDLASLLASADIIPHPAPFTELYFENTSSLPRQTRMGQVYNFSFTIRNLENRSMDYTYAVYIRKGDHRINLDTRSLSLANDQVRTVTTRFSPFATQSSEVIVELTNLDQSIHFWTDSI